MKNPLRTKVENSSNVKAVEFNEETQTLYVEYGGKESAVSSIYRYKGVDVHEGRILEATAGNPDISTGHWINVLIKPKGKYEYTKLGV